MDNENVQPNAKVLDAGWGQRGMFTLLSHNGDLFIHYNKMPDGYAVFQMKDADEHCVRQVNSELARMLNQAKENIERAAVNEQQQIASYK